jgi:hypothetical protein
VSENGAEEHRLAAILAHRRGDDRAVGVVDRGGAQWLSRLNQFVAGGDDGDARPARDQDLRDPAGRAHADLARADHGAGPQQHLAARDIGAGIRYELPRRGGTSDFDRAIANGLGMLDHHDGISTARQRTAGRNGCGRARQHRPRRRGAAGDDLVGQHDPDRRRLAGGGEIGGAHREAVHVGAIERWHVDRRHDIGGQCTAERVGKPPRLVRDGARKQRGFETCNRVFAGEDGQELILIDAVAAFRNMRIAHVGTQLSRATYKQ